MLLATAAVLTLALLAYTFAVRVQDLPPATEAAPWQHLESRKAAIYENLRDLQFEYRVGKLSDDDYARTKKELQAELAGVLAEIDRLKGGSHPVAAEVAASSRKAAPAAAGTVCPHCKARFDQPLKFCGECGKAMGVGT